MIAIKKVSISESSSSKAAAFFDELTRKKEESIKKASDATKDLVNRLLASHAKK